jgi:uncharacterized membrane protein YgcG
MIVDEGGASAGKPAIQTSTANRDPFNWAAAIAANKKQQNTKKAAKKKIQAARTPKAISTQRAPAAPVAPVLTPKQSLDAFRAANGGALPPGMDQGTAALIDSGIDIASLTATNPAMANLMQQIQAQITATPGMYAAGKASVDANYANLTGDVLSSGKNWMQDLYGRMVDPNDPNSALVQNDPALTGYAQSMSTIDETGDQNQATDDAWFDKMSANNTDMYKNMLIQMAAQAALPAGGSGSGGHGGGHGRGHGYGGGGGSGGSTNGWKVPSNKLSNLTSATDTGTTTDTGFSPGYYDDLVSAASAQDPDLAALFQSVWETSTQDPRGVTQDTRKALTTAEEEAKRLELQRGLHQNWIQTSPGAVQSSIGRMISNRGGIRGDDPSTKDVIEPWYIPKKEGQNTPQIIVPTPEQTEQNQTADELLAAQSKIPALRLMTALKTGKAVHAPTGPMSEGDKLAWQTGGAISPTQLKILATHGRKAYSAAKTLAGKDMPLDIQDWAGSGGYVPGVDEPTAQQNLKNIDYYNWILDNTLQWNPNANFVPTRETQVHQGKDSSTYTSSNTNKGWPNALAGNPTDLSPDIPTAAIENDPLSNPGGFNDIFSGATTDELSTGGPTGRLMRLPAGSRATLDKAASSIMGNKPAIRSASKDRIRPRPRPKSVSQAIRSPFGNAPEPSAPRPRPRTSPRPSSNLTFRIFGAPPERKNARGFVQGRGPVVNRPPASSSRRNRAV